MKIRFKGRKILVNYTLVRRINMSSNTSEKVRRTIMALERPVTQESSWSLRLNEYFPLSLRMNLQTKKTKVQDKSALKRGDTNLKGLKD
jgi:hypothetical protein